MAQGGDLPDINIRQGRQRQQELAPHHSTVLSSLDAGISPAALNTDTHPVLPCSTWISMERFDIHCTVDDHRRQYEIRNSFLAFPIVVL